MSKIIVNNGERVMNTSKIKDMFIHDAVPGEIGVYGRTNLNETVTIKIFLFKEPEDYPRAKAKALEHMYKLIDGEKVINGDFQTEQIEPVKKDPEAPRKNNKENT